MTTIGQTRTDEAVAIRRVGESVWILRPTEALGHHAVEVLRDAFLEAVDSGAQNIVVDLSDVDTMAAGGAETILAMADLMRGRNGSLWLAARWSEGEGHSLRAIDERGPRALVGVSAVLDAALEHLSSDVRTTVAQARAPLSDLRKPSHTADCLTIDPGAPLRHRS